VTSDNLETLLKDRHVSEAVALRRPICVVLPYIFVVLGTAERFSRPVVEPCVAALRSLATLTLEEEGKEN